MPDSSRVLPVRRSPRLGRFLLTAGLIGLVLGALVGRLGPDAPQSTAAQEVILMAALGLLVGLLVGAVVYLLVDRQRRP